MHLPDIGYVDARTILGDRRHGIPGIIPVSPSTWWAGVRSGRYPAPVRHGARTFWRVGDIRELIDRIDADDTAGAPHGDAS